MAQFVLYTYQFSPHQLYNNDQRDLFGDVYLLSAESAMKDKLSIFSSVITSSEFLHQGNDLNSQMLYNQHGIIAFKLANKKRLMLSDNFLLYDNEK